MKLLLCVLIALACSQIPAAQVMAQGLPADKVTVSASNTTQADSDPNDTNAENKILFGPIPYKMSTAGDLTATVSMECKIVTQTTVKGGGAAGGAVLTDSERGFARVWIELESLGNPGNVVVLNATDFPAESDPNCDTTCVAVNAGAVTMCDRAQSLSLSSTGDEVLTLRLATLAAHAFTWFGENLAKVTGSEGAPLGNEVNFRVKAQVFGEKGGVIQVRKRTFVIEPAKFVH